MVILYTNVSKISATSVFCTDTLVRSSELGHALPGETRPFSRSFVQFVPFEKRYPPEWFHDPSAPQPKMELDEVPVQDTWQAMEKLHEGGLVKNIGVANFNCHGLRDLFSYAKIKPAVLQVRHKISLRN